MGSVLGIALRDRSRAPMRVVDEARIDEAGGVEGDLRGRREGRQVVVVSREGWDAACRALGERVPWTLRRANLYVDGVELAGRAGARLRIGDSVLEITEECQPCARMDEQRPGLRAALAPDWRGGVCCRVVYGGSVRVGSPVEID